MQVKLVALLLFIGCLQASARGYGQKVTIQAQDVSLTEIFKSIRQQTGYYFVYDLKMIESAKNVDMHIKNVPLDEALKLCFRGQSLTYTIVDKTIIVKAKYILIPSADTSVAVSGRVTDDKGASLPGVSVTLKGTQTGTVTNANGVYSIRLPDAGKTLMFSYVGYKKREISLNGRHRIDVIMQADVSSLDQLVVVGYGMARKKDVTAAISSISKDALSGRTLFSLADAMKGEAAGLQIIQNNGTPGSTSTIRIRGASSISAGSTPLYIVDGIMQDDIDDINPGDIESINILKDASGTAQYGARGANGVVLITTKRGKAGKTKVDLYANVGVQSPAHLYSLMNAAQYARAEFLATGYAYTPADAGNPDQPAKVMPGYTYYRDSPLGTPGAFWGISNDLPYHDWQNYASPDSTNTDWQRTMFREAKVQEYRISISGGSENTKFALMGGYFNQQGLIVYSGYKRFNGRFNVEQKLSNSIDMNAHISASRAVYDGFFDGTGSYSGAITSMLRQLPVNPLNMSDLEDNEDVDGYITTNPYSIAKYATNKKYRADIRSRIAFNWDINKNFMFKVTGNYTSLNADNDLYYPKHISAGARSGGRAVVTRGKTTALMNENLLYYEGELAGKHHFKAMGGAIFEQHKNSTISAENQNFEVESLGVYGLGYGTIPIIPTYGISTWMMTSFLGRVEYGFKDKYLATVNVRADGSSRFGKSNKWGYFPSAALAWRVSEENFMKSIKQISYLKLRASLGQSGNTAIPSYLTLSTIGTSFSAMDGGPDPDFGVIVDRPENPSLKWETTTMLNGGIDMGLFSEKVNLTAEWYLKRTKDLLIQKVVPGYSGYETAWTNFGSIQNSGMEVTVSAAILDIHNIGWTLQGNIGLNRSKAIDIGSDLNLDPGVVPGAGTSAIIRNGQSLGQWYGYQTDGIYKSKEGIKSSGITSIFGTDITDIPPGYRKFVDQNGDGVIDAGDRTVLGRGEPLFYGGLTNLFSYRGFSLNIVLQYSYGNKVYNANRLTLEKGNYNMDANMVHGWSPTLYDMATGDLYEAGHPDNNFPMPGAYTGNFMLSDWVENGSYIRLSDVTLSYSFSDKVLHKIRVDQLKIFASGKNLWLLTRYSGYDPEVNTGQGGFGDLMPSLDYASYPRSRVYSFGIDLQF